MLHAEVRKEEDSFVSKTNKQVTVDKVIERTGPDHPHCHAAFQGSDGRTTITKETYSKESASSGEEKDASDSEMPGRKRLQSIKLGTLNLLA